MNQAISQSLAIADPANADENMKLTDCYYEKKDWRLCKKEVSRICIPDQVERRPEGLLPPIPTTLSSRRHGF